MNKLSVLLFWLWSITTTAHALPIDALWKNLWQTPDQQGAALMQKHAYAAAQQRFQNPDWQAAAAYRNGQYQQAASGWRAHPSITNQYNLGNALAHLHDYQGALHAYQSVLKQQPTHADAAANARLMETLLKNTPQPPQQQQQQQQQQQPNPSQPQTPGQSSPNESDPSQTPSPRTPSEQQTPAKPSSDTPDTSPESAAEKEPTPPPSQPNLREASPKPTPKGETSPDQEQQQSNQQWLKLVPEHPGGLLRQQFLRDHLKRQQGAR